MNYFLTLRGKTNNKFKYYCFYTQVVNVSNDAIISHAYAELTATRNLSASPTQQHVVTLLDNLDRDMVANNESNTPSYFHYWSKKAPTKGLYLHGDTGSGKTMLLDLFYNNTRTPVASKQRKHFHSFMLDIHRQLHAISKLPKNNSKREYPLLQVADSILSDGSLLCLDEFQVTGP